MKKSTKIIFHAASKDLRRQLHQLDRHPAEFMRMTNLIPRPDFVVQTDGKRVKYTGP